MASEAEDLLLSLRAQQPNQARQMLDELRGQVESPSLGETISTVGSTLFPAATAIGETALGVATGLTGLVGGGIAGAGTLLTGGGFERASENIRKVQDFLTIQPSTPAGQEALQSVGEALEGVVRTIEGGIAGGAELVAGRGIAQAAETIEQVREEGPGEAVFERTGIPALATAADLFVDVALLGTTPIKGLKGVQAPKSIPTSKIPKAKVKAREIIVEQFVRDEIPITEAIGKLEADPSLLIADVGDANVSAALKIASNVTREARELSASTIGQRLSQTRDRMIDFTNETLLKGKSVLQEKANIFKKSSDDAKGFYEAAYADDVVLTPELSGILSEPAIASVGKSARKLISFKSVSGLAPKLTAEQKALGLSMFDEKGNIIFENINMVGLDHLKRALNQKSRGTRAKKSELAQSFEDAAANLTAELRSQSSSYGNALNVWIDRSSAEQAFVDGQNALKNLGDPQTGLVFTKQQFEQLSDIDKAMFRLAAGETLIGKLKSIRDTAKGGEPPSSISNFAGDKNSREILSTIFEDTKQSELFSGLVERERLFSETARNAGASTTQRLALQESIRPKRFREKVPAVATDVAFAASQNRFAVLRLIGDVAKIGKKLSPEVTAEMAKILSDPALRFSELNEMARLAGEIPKNVQPLFNMSDSAVVNWFKAEKNRNAFISFGARALAADRENLGNN